MGGIMLINTQSYNFITTYKLNKKNPLKLYNITKDILEEFEDTKGVIRIQISKNDQKKSTKGQNIHIKLKIELHEPH